jgi:hypothetical protein
VDSYYERRISIRQANGVIDFIRNAMVKSFRDPRPGSEPKAFIETDLFNRQLENYLRRTRVGRKVLLRNAKGLVPDKLLNQIAKHLGSKVEDLTVMDVLHLRNHEYKRIAGIDATEVSQVKLRLLGVVLKDDKSTEYK